MRNTLMKRTIALFFSITLLISAFCCAVPLKVKAAETENEKLVSHLINVVYDDSNSMLLDNRLWWCYAKYSLEVFSAMMQDKDSMNIYYMSDGNSSSRISNLSGDKSQQQNNVNAIHNTVTNTSGTPFASIEKAYSDLKWTSGYDEKWLMVITDGDSFNNNEKSEDIDRLIADCSDNNIKVVYLAIGNALVPTENTSKGIYVYKADGQVSSGNTGILSRVTQICQRIFQRPSLKTAKSGNLVLDVPTSEIIVFAQGSNVSIGDIDGTKKTLSLVSMTAADKDKATINPAYVNSINVDTLNASIATFTPTSGNYIDEGTYDLSISADEYVVYYKPCLDVFIELLDSKENSVLDEYIPVGSYSLRYWLTYPEGHPKHGEKLDQNLFDVDYTLTCNVDGVVRNLASDRVDLTEGETTLNVLAEYLNFGSSGVSLKYVVEDFTITELDVELEYLQQNYRLSTLEKENDGILVKVTRGGMQIPTDEWERFTVKCNAEKLDFGLVKNNDSTLILYPQYYNGNRDETASGDITFDIAVYASNDHRITDAGTVEANINIYDDITSVPLGVTISEQGGICDNKNFASQHIESKVTIDWNGQNLTSEQYDALVLSVNMEDPIFKAEIELDPYTDGSPTTATLSFSLSDEYKDKSISPKELHGDKQFTVDAVIDSEGQRSTGTADGVLMIDDVRTLSEKLHDWLPILIPLAILLFLFLGYAPIIKKYLPHHSVYTYGMANNKKRIYWYKNAKAKISVLIPFMAVRSSARTSGTDPVITLDVKARGGSWATLKNAKEICKGKGVLIQNKSCNSATKVNLHQMSITYEFGVAVTKLSAK